MYRNFLIVFTVLLYTLSSYFTSWDYGLDYSINYFKPYSYFFLFIVFVLIFTYDNWSKYLAKIKPKKVYLVIFLLIFFASNIAYMTNDSDRIINLINNRDIRYPYVLNYFTIIMFNEFFSLFKIDTITTIRLYDALAGVLYIFLAYKLSSEWTKKWILPFILLISIGSTRIFFGSIELYAFIMPLHILYAYYGYLYLVKNKSIMFATITLLLLTLMHTWGFLLFPTLILLPYLKKGNNKIFKVAAIYLIPIILFTFIIFLFQRGVVPENTILYSFIFSESVDYPKSYVFAIHPYLCVNCLCENFCTEQVNYNGFKAGYPAGGFLPFFTPLSGNPSHFSSNVFSIWNMLGKTWLVFAVSGPIMILFVFCTVKLRRKHFKDKVLIFFTSLVIIEILRIFSMFLTNGDWDAFTSFSAIFPIWTGYFVTKNLRNYQLIAVFGLFSIIILIMSITQSLI